VRHNADDSMGKVTRYSYVQIESAEKEKDPRLNKRQAQTEEQFTIRVNFYNKDLDVNKKKVVKFKCNERAEEDDSDDEEMKSFERTDDQTKGRRSNVNMVGLLGDHGESGPLCFSVLYMIQRQLPIFW